MRKRIYSVMTQEEFIKILVKKRYSYKIEGDKIVVTHKSEVYLNDLSSLPPGVVFKNKGDVDLDSLTSLPPGVVFKNNGVLSLRSLKTLPLGVEFKNTNNVILNGLKTIHLAVEFMNERDVFLPPFQLLRIHPGVEFNNGLGVYFTSKPGWYALWESDIEGIDSKRLLNFMISKGFFI